MRMTHQTHPQPTVPGGRRRLLRQDGYVVAMLGLLLVPLLLMAGLAVDVGYWYNQASDIQKAADAASLAGVVWLPNDVKAREVALDVAKRNGYDDAASNVTVTAIPSTKSPHRLEVKIQDDRVGSFFYSSLGGRNLDMSRNAFAEYVLPVKMGSPENKLGNDPTAPDYPNDAPNLWSSISGPQSNTADGDPYSTKKSSQYRTWGYLYVVDVPAAAVNNSMKLSVYDAGNYARTNYPNFETADNGTVNTQFELFRPDDTPLNALDGLVPGNSMEAQCTAGPGRFRILNGADPAIYKNQWVDLCQFTPDVAGQWIMQVKSSDIPTVTDSTGGGWNQFSVRAISTGPKQPALYTIGDLSLFNNLPGQSGDINASFYLAEIPAIHAGKTLEVSLFDPGDGQSGEYYANIKGPGGITASCNYRSRGSATWATSPNCRINTRKDGSNAYQGKWLDIQISLANSYTCTTDCWWKVLYEFKDVEPGKSPNDRTVWSAKVIGDPVHLIEES